MKKISIFMAIAAAASLASCTAQAPKANLKSDIDSLSYSIGMAQTQGLKGYGPISCTTRYRFHSDDRLPERFQRRCNKNR